MRPIVEKEIGESGFLEKKTSMNYSEMEENWMKKGSHGPLSL